MNLLFVLNSIGLGVGLAMDAFSVSVVDGLKDPQMKVSGMARIAATFAGFQFLMPLAGWVLVHTAVQKFAIIDLAVPWIALVILCFIGFNMIRESFAGEKESSEAESAGTLVMQGIATSIDALSVGLTIADYELMPALTASVIIGLVTFVICMAGVRIGQTVGTKLSAKAGLLGGVILIGIGIEIFLSHML